MGVHVRKLSVNDFYALFGRTPEQTRWQGSADSEEYLALVAYLVERVNGRNRRIV